MQVKLFLVHIYFTFKLQAVKKGTRAWDWCLALLLWFFNFVHFSSTTIVTRGATPTLNFNEWTQSIEEKPRPNTFNLREISFLFQTEWLKGYFDLTEDTEISLNATLLKEYFEDSLDFSNYCEIVLGDKCVLDCTTNGICGGKYESCIEDKNEEIGYKCVTAGIQVFPKNHSFLCYVNVVCFSSSVGKI